MLPKKLIDYYKLCNIRDNSSIHPITKLGQNKLAELPLKKYFKNDKLIQKITGAEDPMVTHTNRTQNYTHIAIGNPTNNATNTAVGNPTNNSTNTAVGNPTNNSTDAIVGNPTNNYADAAVGNPTNNYAGTAVGNSTNDATYRTVLVF